MRLTKFNVERMSRDNVGNYEHDEYKVGSEWAVEDGENEHEAAEHAAKFTDEALRAQVLAARKRRGEGLFKEEAPPPSAPPAASPKPAAPPAEQQANTTMPLPAMNAKWRNGKVMSGKQAGMLHAIAKQQSPNWDEARNLESYICQHYGKATFEELPWQLVDPLKGWMEHNAKPAGDDDIPF